MKKVISCIIGIAALFALTGCGYQRTKSDNEILKELNTGTIQYGSQELTIQEIEITDRRTDTDNKKDLVFISIIADNDIVSCEMSYVANYIFYDQGWILDSFLENNRDSWIIKPVSAPENKLLEEHSHDSYIDSDILLDEGTAFYYYEKVDDEIYCSTIYLCKARYEFDTKKTEWKYIDYEIVETQSEWDVDGTWSYVSTPGVYVMGGSAFESENHHMMMNIEVNDGVAHVVAYSQGDNIVYYVGDITLTPGKGGCSDTVKFSYECPGFDPIEFWGEIYIEPDRVFVNWASQFERISTDNNNLFIATIRYDANGGYGAPEDQSVVIVDGAASYILSEEQPYRDGYNFVGWKLENSDAYDIDNPGQSIAIGLSESCTLTYYAQWN